ncbi:MAG: PEP-CTERM sorting domain-containing protein [Planctomycetaceae bacterium]|jgi:hypothetical protein|nr:PEP-CTERM sorting domain-containing protein [Planctomycetaceae bacterium]
MKTKFKLTFLLFAITITSCGIVLADISPSGADASSLGNYANEYRVDADQPENTNNCTMNSMEGAKAPDTPLEDPNDLSAIAPQPFVDDVWDASNPVANDDPTIPSPPYYPYYPEEPPAGTPQNTPEPATLLLVGAGICSLLPFTKRNRIKRR